MIGYRAMSTALALVTLGLGVVLLVWTTAQGGGETGYLIGVLFLAAGGGRLYLLRRRG